MRKAIFFAVFLPSVCWGSYNPTTGGGSSLPLPGGATNYIQNTSTLQSGATAYPSFIYVGSSETVTGALKTGTTMFAPVISNFPSQSQIFQLSNSFSPATIMTLSNDLTSGMVMKLGNQSSQQTNIQNASGIEDGTGSLTAGGKDQLFLGQNAGGGSYTIGFSMTASTTTRYAITIATSAFTTSNPLYIMDVSTTGHINFPESASVIGTTVTSCGTTPTLVGNDTNGAITVGSGIVTACTLTFGKQYTNTPVCTISDNSTAITGDISSLSNTSATFSFSASLGGGIIYYLCHGMD